MWLELEIKLMEEKVKVLLPPPLEDGQSKTWAVWVWLEPDKGMDSPSCREEQGLSSEWG